MNQSSLQTNSTPLLMMMMSSQLDADAAANSNGFDNFLDIFSTDMDFEQAYSMYNTLQQKSAIGTFEELNKVQMLNSQYTTNLPTPPPHPQHQQQHYSSVSSDLPQDEFADSRQQILNGGHQYIQEQPKQQQQPQQQIEQQQLEQQQLEQQQHQQQHQQEEENDDFDHFFTNTESNALERFLDSLTNPKATADPLQFYQNSRSPKSNNNNNMEFDFNFEMRTMNIPPFTKQSQKPAQQQPQQQLQLQQQFQNYQAPQLHQPQPFYPTDTNFHASSSSPMTMSTTHSNVMQAHFQQQPHSQPQHHQQQQLQDHVALKNELAEAFSVPAKSPFSSPPLEKQVKEAKQAELKATRKSQTKLTKLSKKDTKTEIKQESMSLTSSSNSQLITPPTSGDESRKRQGIEEDEEEEEYDSDDNTNSTTSSSPKRQLKKRRRSTNKPLLSIEQKRLNHSHSEQKRRQLCKQAYQRCLEQIIDLDAFAKLPELNEAERKTKRARVNKEGLPNLSKHGALMRISNEMTLIKQLNDGLKKLLEG